MGHGVGLLHGCHGHGVYIDGRALGQVRSGQVTVKGRQSLMKWASGLNLLPLPKTSKREFKLSECNNLVLTPEPSEREV